MSLANTGFMETPIKNPTKKGIMVITAMPSYRIVGYLAYRHRVGLLAFSNVLLVSYLAWDKVLHIFF